MNNDTPTEPLASSPDRQDSPLAPNQSTTKPLSKGKTVAFMLIVWLIVAIFILSITASSSRIFDTPQLWKVGIVNDILLCLEGASLALMATILFFSLSRPRKRDTSAAPLSTPAQRPGPSLAFRIFMRIAAVFCLGFTIIPLAFIPSSIRALHEHPVTYSGTCTVASQIFYRSGGTRGGGGDTTDYYLKIPHREASFEISDDQFYALSGIPSTDRRASIPFTPCVKHIDMLYINSSSKQIKLTISN